jgi:hypothetical protein
VAQRLSERLELDWIQVAKFSSKKELGLMLQGLAKERDELKEALKLATECHGIEYMRAEKSEAEVKDYRALYYTGRARNGDLEARLERVKRLIAEEWDSSTCIVDSEKIEEYEHCTCAEDYANVFVKRLKVLLG